MAAKKRSHFSVFSSDLFHLQQHLQQVTPGVVNRSTPATHAVTLAPPPPPPPPPPPSTPPPSHSAPATGVDKSFRSVASSSPKHRMEGVLYHRKGTTRSRSVGLRNPLLWQPGATTTGGKKFPAAFLQPSMGGGGFSAHGPQAVPRKSAVTESSCASFAIRPCPIMSLLPSSPVAGDLFGIYLSIPTPCPSLSLCL